MSVPIWRVIHNERAPCVVDVDHGARVALQRRRDRVDLFGGHFTALPDGVRDAHDCAMDLVRNLQDVAVRDPALQRVVV